MRLKSVTLCSTALIAVLWTTAAAAQAQNTQGTQVPQAGQGTSGTGTPNPTDQVPLDPVQVDGDAPVEEEIVVTGLRRSLESAQAIKRNSDAIVDAIVAEDIGKLPDTFASSALARVQGVNVTRAAGESAGVTVRGLPDLSTTYNGRDIFTAEGRFVAIQDFPAGTVAALEVFKSSTANLIEGGIGGQINVRGRRPFDFKGFELSGSLNGVAFEQSDKLSVNGNVLVSTRWDTGIGEMGLLVNASYVGINFLDSTREQALVIATTNAGQGVQAGVRYPDAQGIFFGRGDRFRPSVNAAFQWRPTPELEVYADGLFQGYRGRDTNQFAFVPIFGDLRLSNLVTQEGNPNQAKSFTVANAVRPDGFFGSGNGHTDTYQAGAGAVWNRDNLQISGDIAYTDSRFTFDLLNIDYAFASSPVRNVDFDAGSDGGASLEFVNFDPRDPANYISRGFFQEFVDVSGKDIQTRFDVRYEPDFAFIKRIDVGVRYNDRDARRDRATEYRNNEGDRIPLSNLPLSLRPSNAGFDFDDAINVRSFVSASRQNIRANADALRTFFNAPVAVFNPTENFTANEKALALYGQVKYGFEVGDIVVDGLVGLRGVRTETRVTGFSREVDAPTLVFTPTTRGNKYTDYLPNVSARIAFTPEVQLRLAYTQTRTRPNFFDLTPNQTVGRPATPPPECTANPALPGCNTNSLRRGVSGGNPDLDPLTSDNYDVSLEWYFSRSGSLTGAIFRRDAEGFIFRQSLPAEDPVLGPIQLDGPFNSGSTRFQGAEVGFTSFLDLEGVPEWARGFGLQANGTYVDSEGDRSPFFNELSGDARVRFNGVSKWSYNLVALYERPIFSARLAYNYRSNFVQFYGTENFDDVAAPTATDPNRRLPRVRGVIERGRGQLDFSTTYTPIPNVTIAFDIVNLLGNPLQRYRDYNDAGDSFERQTIYLERVYSLGVRFRL